MQPAGSNIALKQYTCIRVMCNVELLRKKNSAKYSCFPDGITLLDWVEFTGAESWTPSLTTHMADETFAIALVGVNSRLSEDSVSSVLSCQASRLIFLWHKQCGCSGPYFRRTRHANGTPILRARLQHCNLCMLCWYRRCINYTCFVSRWSFECNTRTPCPY